jgi:CRISPR locus-related DNA-binding protein
MHGEKERVVISTFYEGFAVKHIIPKLSPTKLIIILDDLKAKEQVKQKISESLSSITEFFKGVLEIETVRISSSYNIPLIIKEVVNKIDSEFEKNKEVLIHISEGRKTTCLGLLYASYIRNTKVEGAYYLTEEDHELIRLPMLNFEINQTKKEILKMINSGKEDIENMMKRLDLKQSAIYYNLNELKKDGYVKKDGNLELTDLGKVMIMD